MIIKNTVTKEVLEKIRILAFDMDGTLLDEKGALSSANAACIRRAMEKGYHIVIATGRGYSAFPEAVMNLEGIRYMISSNGAHIVDQHTGETIYSNLLTREAVEAAMPWISDPELMREVFFHHKVYADKHCMEDLPRYGVLTEKSQKYVLETRKPVEDAVALIREYADQLENINLLFPDGKKRLRYWAELKGINGLTVVSSMPYNIELGGATTSKATALKALAERLGLSHDNIMSFGDSSNDAQMLAAAQVAVAMGNAVEELKEAADVITLSNAEDGVAYALSRLLDL
ncbi:MAG: HAD family hydrolase [Bacillota bacterium]|jgi:Cof subfamily protein (haloacid dehalogenase superfamily)|nr:HAD family hydrolase [Eubacteriales bacterium]MDD4285465.1 HAD family hydrolase [Eubacteriales bacterium]MDI9491606.1 HAD family hydrolase [Bacillota bacterium]HPF18543.1 HAD family hydrolase [Bacillota bacterium]HRV33408.1 HAD family hydrolase [Anaerovoracaceae bacterium]